MNKKELRLKYKSLRKSLKPEKVEELSISVANQLLKIQIWNNRYFHIFLPIETLKELNTEYILHILSGKDKEVVISKSNFATTTMTHFLLTDNTKIIKNEFNISEPVDSLEIPIFKIDVVFVPLLAFDEIGNRVGYGKGFYDKFLAKCNSETIKIGLSFFDAEFEITDVNTNDIRLDYCVTPYKVYKF